LQDGISINAISTDINITMSGDVLIQGQTPQGNSRLYFNATGSRKITVFMDHNVTFRGSAAALGTPEDLLIVVQGLGQVIFQMEGGTKLLLARNGVGGGSVQMYLLMEDPSGDVVPELIFQRDPAEPSAAENTEVELQIGSILSYLARTVQPNATEKGTIRFKAQNLTGIGRSVLTLQDQSACIIRGRLLQATVPEFTINDIDPSMPAGLEARCEVHDDASLVVQNFNNTIGEFLWDPFCNLEVRQNPPFGNFSGLQYGFILGSFGTLDIGTDTYLDYVGLTGTNCVNPTPPIPGVPAGQQDQWVKPRSGSAFFTDAQPDGLFTAPFINIQETAAIYFRSGVNNEGVVENPLGTLPIEAEFTISPDKRTPGAGIPVFDIEGVLNIQGANTATEQHSKFELLSLEVAPTGGPLFDPGVPPLIFPLRTFATQSVTDRCTGVTTTTYVSYNNANFFNNGRVNLFDVTWDHTDENHHVFEKNDTTSEPAYIGGETWAIKRINQDDPYCLPKPKWAFINSRFNVHTSVALTGVDLLVPNGFALDEDETCVANKSQFVFYQNGKAIDNGTGRQMVLGTFVGSTACDGCTVICKDAQLDVMQTQECDAEPTVDSCDPSQGLRHSLCLESAPNTSNVVQDIPAPEVIENQYSIQTIYLGNTSNISVGTDGTEATSMDPNLQTQETFPLTTCPELLIAGNFYSFETRGGSNGLPETSNVTGQGGIFVDMNGTFSIGSEVCRYRANMGAMVTQSRNGIVDLPKNQVFFDSRVGVANWNLDLNDPAQRIIVPANRCLSDYTLNWLFTTKDYDVFCPYIVDCLNTCTCPDVVQMNVDGIPTVQGTVQQFQIAGSRLGDPAHLKVDGGVIGELVMLTGWNSAEAPVAVVVLENKATVGLGTAHRNVDSVYAEIQLGVNGVTLILNGDESTVVVNEDLIINNVCAILPGPNIEDEPATLRFTSDCCNTIRVTKDGVLDLRAFGDNQVIEFAGNVRVVFEPGARVILDTGNAEFEGPVLRWAENATCEFNPVVNTNNLFDGDTLANTDNVRVRFVGRGVLEFTDCSRSDLPRDAFVGIESLPECGVFGADVRLRITDSAAFYIGDVDCKTYGGALQVGNVESDLSPVVTFSLILDGPRAKFEVGPQGFFGTGVGVVEKGHTGHDTWRVAPTANLQNVSFDLQNGVFRHPQVYAGDDVRSALIAISNSIDGNSLDGQGVVYDFFCDPIPDVDKFSGPLLSKTSILGGGNFVATFTTAGTIFPIVQDVNGQVDNTHLAGLLTSKPLIQEATFEGEDAAITHNFLRVQDIQDFTPVNGRGVAAPSCNRNEVRVAYVDRGDLIGFDGFIARADLRLITGRAALTSIQEHTLELGAIGLSLTTNFDDIPRPIVNALELGA
jgi:hypothetical protein